MPDETVLLHNVSAHVAWVAPGQLRCEVTGRVVTALLVAAGLGASALGAGALIAAVNLPFPDPRPLMFSGVVALLCGFALLGLAWTRRRNLGIYLFDAAQQQLARLVGAQVAERWRFDQIQSVVERVDITDGTRLDLLPRLPAWLVLITADGRHLRVAKGGAAELAGVRGALAELGVKAASPGT